MRFRNGKKSFGLIAVLSCVLTATVAFAAYTGLNYINGTVTVEGSPFKMVFAESVDSEALEDGGTILSYTAADAIGSAEAGDIEVHAYDPDGRASTINSFNVTLKEVDDQVIYSFAIKNTGGATAYLESVRMGATELPLNNAGAPVSGLSYSIAIPGGASGFSVESDGAEVSQQPDGGTTTAYTSVDPGESREVRLTVSATDDSLFSAYDAGAETFGAEITLGQITITWSAVDPSKPTT